MAVAFDAATSPAASQTVDFSWTHTPVGTPRGVVVWIVQGDDDPTDRINGVTYGGTAMTEVTGSPLLSPGSVDRGAVYCYFLGSSIPTGDQTVSVDTDGTAREKHALCVSLTASADTEIQDVDATINTTSATNPSVTLSLGGKTCWCGSGIRSGAGLVTDIAPLTDWTSRLEHDYGSQCAGFYTYDIVGTSDVTAGWTQAAEDAQQIAIAITEVAGGGDTSESRSGTVTAAATGTGRIAVQNEKRSTVTAGATDTGRIAVQDAKRSTVAGTASVTGVSAFANANWEKAGSSQGSSTVTGRIAVVDEKRSTVASQATASGITATLIEISGISSAGATNTGRITVQDAKRSTVTAVAAVNGVSDFVDDSTGGDAARITFNPMIASVGRMMGR